MLSENVENLQNPTSRPKETILSINPDINYEDSRQNPIRSYQILASFVDNTADIFRSEHDLDSVRNQLLPIQTADTPPLIDSSQGSSILNKFLIILKNKKMIGFK